MRYLFEDGKIPSDDDMKNLKIKLLRMMSPKINSKRLFPESPDDKLREIIATFNNKKTPLSIKENTDMSSFAGIVDSILFPPEYKTFFDTLSESMWTNISADTLQSIFVLDALLDHCSQVEDASLRSVSFLIDENLAIMPPSQTVTLDNITLLASMYGNIILDESQDEDRESGHSEYSYNLNKFLDVYQDEILLPSILFYLLVSPRLQKTFLSLNREESKTDWNFDSVLDAFKKKKFFLERSKIDSFEKTYDYISLFCDCLMSPLYISCNSELFKEYYKTENHRRKITRRNIKSNHTKAKLFTVIKRPMHNKAKYTHVENLLNKNLDLTMRRKLLIDMLQNNDGDFSLNKSINLYHFNEYTDLLNWYFVFRANTTDILKLKRMLFVKNLPLRYNQLSTFTVQKLMKTFRRIHKELLNLLQPYLDKNDYSERVQLLNDEYMDSLSNGLIIELKEFHYYYTHLYTNKTTDKTADKTAKKTDGVKTLYDYMYEFHNKHKT